MSKKLKTPPVLPGAFPLIGHLSNWENKQDLLRKGHKEYGDIFTIKMGPKPTVILIGPELNRFFFTQTDKLLNISKPYNFLKYILGDVVFLADHKKYLNQRTLIFEPFRRAKMMRYLDIMQYEVQKWLDGLGAEGRMDLTANIVEVTQKVAAHALMGKNFNQKLGKEFWSKYTILGKAMTPWSVILPPKFPLPQNIRRDKARKEMAAILKPLLTERRKNPGDYDDYLQDILHAKLKDGTLPTDEDLLGMIITLMFAGHETTAGQAAWTVIQLLQNPGYLAILQNELRSTFPYGQKMTPDLLSKLNYTRYAVEETSRMRPSADMLLRMVNEDIELGGYRIPKGWIISVSAEVSHFLPEYFKDPFKYDPMRFAPDRKEHSQDRFLMTGFGGGTHKCAGLNFANNEMTIITALLMQQFDLELETTDPGIYRGMGANRPEQTWVRYKRKPVDELVSQEVLEEALGAGCPHLAKMQAEEAKKAAEKQDV